MRKLYFIFLMTYLSAGLYSQTGAPPLINYQAIARDASGNIINTGSIGIKFEVMKGVVPVTVYAETQTSSPSAAGIFTAAIGGGIVTAGNFSTINWANGPYYLRVSIDPTGGTSYSVVGTNQLISVPYAFYAENTKPSTLSLTGDTLSISGGNMVILPLGTTYSAGSGITIAGNTISNSSPNQTVTISNGTNVNVTGVYPNYTVSSTPTLSVTGAQMSISGGNTVTLPTGTTYTNGAGISLVSGTIITNTAPDQTVTITPGNSNITIGGGYPNFTVADSPTLTFGAGVLSISNGNSVVIPGGPPPTSITATGASTVAGAGPSFTINTAIPSFATVGTTSITGAFPNFSVNTPAQILTSNNFTLTSNLGGSAMLPGYTAGAGLSSAGAYPNYTLSASSSGTNAVWSTLGNSLTNSGVNFLGTTDAVDLVFKTANTERARILGTGANAGYVGIGTAAPASRLHVADVNSKILVDATGGGASVAEIDFKTVSAGTASVYKFNTGRLAMASGGAYNMQFLNSIGGSFQFDEGVNTRVYIAAGGSVGIGTLTPNSLLHVNGPVTITDGSQGDGKILGSDPAGKGTWKNTPPAVAFGNLNNTSTTVTTVFSPLGIGSITFNKVYPNTEVEIFLHTLVYTGSFVGASWIQYELCVDGATTPIANYHASFTALVNDFLTIKAIFQSLGTGIHTITLLAKTNAGTANGVLVDSGGFGGKIIVKENF